MIKDRDQKIVAEFWSTHEPDELNYYCSPITRPHLIKTAYGQELSLIHKDNKYFAEDIFIDTHLKHRKVESILSLCCGFGESERYFVSRLPDVKYCLGLDLAEGALKEAKERAHGMNIDYELADLNKYPWQENRYDLVIAQGALHHLSNLEGVISGIYRTLKPGGILYSCEYVGPSYQDHSIRQLQLINATAFLVPPELRARKGLSVSFEPAFRVLSWAHSLAVEHENPAWPGWKKNTASLMRKVLKRNHNKLDFGKVHISPKNMLLKIDPSECVRSADIIPVLQKTFRDLNYRSFGGGILLHALDINFYANFNSSNPLHTNTIEMLSYLENHYENVGEIGMENAFLVAVKDK